MRWTVSGVRERIDTGKEIGKGASRERHLKERGRVSLVLSDRVWEMSPYCIRTVDGR